MEQQVTACGTLNESIIRSHHSKPSPALEASTPKHDCTYKRSTRTEPLSLEPLVESAVSTVHQVYGFHESTKRKWAICPSLARPRENMPHGDFSLLINCSLLTENGSMSIFAQQDPTADPLCVFGVRTGYSPQIGIFVSQLNWMRRVVLSRLQSLSIDDLDWLPNPDGNSIGALLIHLASTEIYYGLNTFDALQWGRYPYEIRKKWGVAMALGETARVRHRGFHLQYYLSHLADARTPCRNSASGMTNGSWR